MNTTIIAHNTTDHKKRTHEATVANIFAAKERHDRRVEEALERTARENPESACDLLWI